MCTIFISYASEDRTDVAEPLAELLSKEGVKVWYDKYVLKIGDSLRDAIDNGLKSADYGLVILSFNFFKKKWTEYELSSLVTLERVYSPPKKILPIWHKLKSSDIVEYSPNLADKVAADTSAGLENVMEDILRAIGKKRQVNFEKPETQIIKEKNISHDIEDIVELLKILKRTKYLWLGLCELSDKQQIVSEEVKETTLSDIKGSLDKLLLMGHLVYETKYSYDMITTKQKVYLITVFNISTQVRNLIQLVQKGQL
ncbi:MAG: toll/interleukin-1 receptor domain-containing protein [Chitinophagaceae bacterium]